MRQRSLLIAVLGLAAIAFLASGMGWSFGGFWGAGPMGWGMMGGHGPMMGRGPMMGGAPPAGWGSYGSGYGPGGSSPPALLDGSGAPAPGSGAGGEAAPSVPEITVEMSEFAFGPKTFSWKAGEPVRVRIVNRGRTYHDFTVPGLPVRLSNGRAQEGIQVALGPGGSQVVQFTPTESGRFPLLCTVPGHAPAGMQGEVTVL